MDTIFVRNVRLASAAHNAGLRTGDRIVSVNGVPVSSRTYSDVVKDIQRCVTTLHLLVVPCEEDLLQQVFGKTAHNPESNLDFKMSGYTPTPSPQPPYNAYAPHTPQHPALHGLAPSQGIVDAGSMAYPITVPGGSVTTSAWSSQSSLASFHPNLVPFHAGPALASYPSSQMLPSGQPLQPLQPQPHSTPPSSTTLSTAERKPCVPSAVSSAVSHQVSSSSTRVSTVPLQTAVSSSASGPRTNLSQLLPQKIQRYDIPAQTMGVYEPVMDRAGPRNSFRDQRRLERDPDGRLYEVVQTRMVESKVDHKDRKASLPGSGPRGSSLVRKPSLPGDQEARRVRVQSLSPPRVFVNPSKQQQANQQRSASVSMRGQSTGGDTKESRARTDSRAGAEGRARAGSRPSSMADHQMGSIESIHSKDKSTQEVLERIKKNVEQKEEFLKRPNQPIWLPESKGPIREYHVSPQKFQKPLWPPPGAQAPPSPGSITKALSFIAPQKPDHHHLRRVKSETENTMSRTRTNSAPTTPTTPSSASMVGTPSPQNHVSLGSSSEPATPTMSPSAVSGVGEKSSVSGNKSLVVNAVPKPYPSAGTGGEANPNSRYGKTFITTLSKIQENIATPEHGSLSSLASNQGTRSTKGSDTTNSAPVTPTGSQTSLLSPAMRAVPLAWVGDNERIQQLHIVSKRAKQFESGRPEREASAKTAFHRFELARLSQRGKVPNVAQRRHEFEQREDESKHDFPGMDFIFGSHYTNVPRQRKSAELLRGGEVPLSSPSPPKVLRSMSDGGNVFPVPRRLYTSHPASEPMRTQSSSDSVVLRAANRTIPVGGPRIHCEPPHGFNSRPQSDSDVLERERSHSLTSQTTQSSQSLWSTQSADEGSHAVSKVMMRPKPVRQNSYLNAVECPDDVSPSLSSPVVVSITTLTSTTTTSSSTTATTAAATTTTSTTPSSASLHVARRHKAVVDPKDDRVVRRVSYLKATSGDRPYSDSDVDSDLEERPCVVDGGLNTPTSSLTPSMVPLCVSELPSPASLQSDVARQGSLHLKFTLVDGKKSGDRSWKAVWAVVQGRALIFYKDKQQAVQTPLGVEEQISLRGAEVDVAADYTKRRHVLRLGTPGGSQLLLQADTQADMLAWLDTLHQNCQSQDGVDSTKTSIASNSINNINNNNNNNNVSPQTSSKAMRKLTSTLRTRSPTGQSPATKNRKAGSIVDSSSSPKSKTWKGRLGRQLKKIQGGSPASTPTHLLPEGATIGMCLEDCPPSPENELVPLLVTLCVGVVEERGLQTQGIYRIPGNTAAVAHLKEIVNKGPEAIDLNDTRWSDVNVISSLLKTFFRSLPDPLISSDLYPHFIEAAKIEEPNRRMSEVRRLVHELPDHHYETLRYLMMHLSRVVNNLETNKMDVKNLAIVFGPTLVRAVDDSMVTMVTDMSHQCRIVEMLISHVDWFFNEEIDGEDLPPPSLSFAPQSPNASDATQEPETPSNHNLLLHNIHKVEGGMKGDSTKKDLVSSIISAANRKVHKVKPKKVLEEGGGGMSVGGGVGGGGGGSGGGGGGGGVGVGSGKDTSKDQDKEGGFRERDVDKEVELRRHRILAKQMDEQGELPDPKPMSERKISSMSMMSVQSIVPGCLSGESSDRKPQAKGDDDGRLFCVVKKEGATSVLPSSLQTPSSATPSSTLAPVSSSSTSVQVVPDPNLGDEVAIRTYAGLSASTQERIRRFEMETRAMLHRDKTRQRKEMEQREFDRKRLEEEWYKAKHDMESDDLLDQLADNPSEVVRKISDYSWHLQGLKESLYTPDRSSLASNISTTSSEAALLAAALSHHNANTPLHSLSTNTTTTTTTTQKVPTSVLESGVARCGSLDSLRDGPPLTIQDDGSDLLSAITATFEEKMRSLQDASSYMSPPSSTHTSVDILACDHEKEEEEEEEEEIDEEGRNYQDQRNINDSKDESEKNVIKKNKGTGDCRLYRDPSLHRRPSSQQSSNSSSVTSKVETQMASQEKYGKQEKKNSKIKRTDSLTKSEKTENNLKEKTEKNLRKSEKNLKEKTEKRSREQTKDVQEGLNDKKPKELRRCEKQDSPTIGSHTPKSCGVRRTEGRDGSSNAGRNRKNVKELKEKFEKSNSGSSSNNCGNSFRKTSNVIGSNAIAVHKGGKSNGRRSGLKAHLKRRHTVGGTKDLAKWINSHLDPGTGSPKGAKMSAWEHLQPLVADESLNVDRSLKMWLAKERLRTSSPDLSCPPTILLPINVDDKENLPRRHSIQETPVKPLYPLPLESQV